MSLADVKDVHWEAFRASIESCFPGTLEEKIYEAFNFYISAVSLDELTDEDREWVRSEIKRLEAKKEFLASGSIPEEIPHYSELRGILGENVEDLEARRVAKLAKEGKPIPVNLPFIEGAINPMPNKPA